MATEVVNGEGDITCKTLESGKRNRVFPSKSGMPTLFDTGLEDSVPDSSSGSRKLASTPGFSSSHTATRTTSGIRCHRRAMSRHGYPPSTTHEDDHQYTDGGYIGQFTAVHLPGHEPGHYGFVDQNGRVVVLGNPVPRVDQSGLPVGYFRLPPSTPRTSTRPKRATSDSLGALSMADSSITAHL